MRLARSFATGGSRVARGADACSESRSIAWYQERAPSLWPSRAAAEAAVMPREEKGAILEVEARAAEAGTPAPRRSASRAASGKAPDVAGAIDRAATLDRLEKRVRRAAEDAIAEVVSCLP